MAYTFHYIMDANSTIAGVSSPRANPDLDIETAKAKAILAEIFQIEAVASEEHQKAEDAVEAVREYCLNAMAEVDAIADRLQTCAEIARTASAIATAFAGIADWMATPPELYEKGMAILAGIAKDSSCRIEREDLFDEIINRHQDVLEDNGDPDDLIEYIVDLRIAFSHLCQAIHEPSKQHALGYCRTARAYADDVIEFTGGSQ